jgi:hypothetical protein
MYGIIFQKREVLFRICSTVALKEIGPAGTRSLKRLAIDLFKIVYIFLKVVAAAGAHG